LDFDRLYTCKEKNTTLFKGGSKVKKIGLVLVIGFAFLVGSFAGNGGFTQAATKYCSAYSYYATCTNSTTNNTYDYTMYRGDVARKLSTGKIEFSSSHYYSNTFSPNYGKGAFYTGHWIASGGTTYSVESIWGTSVHGTDFYISNTSTALSNPEVTTQIQNAPGNVTWAVNAY
jgi:hypothetical protein